MYDFLLRKEENAGEAYYDLLLYALLETIIRQRHNYPAALCRKICAIFYLQSKHHDQARVLLRGCHIMDAAFGEHGVNALLRNILQGVTDGDKAHSKALLYFAKRSSFAARGLEHDMGAGPGRARFVLGRSMTAAVVHAQELIQDIAISLIEAERSNKLPVLVHYNGANRFTSDSYMCPAFFLDRVLASQSSERRVKATKKKFSTYEIGSPAFALNPRAYALRGVSPDDQKGCHMIGCIQPDLPGSHLFLICGHSCCEVCFAKSPRCRDCLYHATVRIEHVATKEQDTQCTRLIGVHELHETALSKQEQAELAEEEIDPDDADDNTGHPDDLGGDDYQGGGLIAKSIKNCERLVGAALKLAQTHRAAAELNFPAGIPAEAAANAHTAAAELNFPAGIPAEAAADAHTAAAELNFPAGIPAEAPANVNALAGIPGKPPSVTSSTLFKLYSSSPSSTTKYLYSTPPHTHTHPLSSLHWYTS